MFVKIQKKNWGGGGSVWISVGGGVSVDFGGGGGQCGFRGGGGGVGVKWGVQVGGVGGVRVDVNAMLGVGVFGWGGVWVGGSGWM